MPSGCKRIIFQGRVQGVGFRFSTARIAKSFPVAGYVKNLSDGTVELVVDAELSVLRNFMDAIEQHFEGYIDNRDESNCSTAEEFREFEIRY